jgi:hypothetical protein
MRPRRDPGDIRLAPTLASFLSYLRLARFDPVQQRQRFSALS